jgi:8-oxo-(d)GTP phosphatase
VDALSRMSALSRMDALTTDVSTSFPVRAAGGVVWRVDGAAAVEIVLVHRPRYNDWSLPKGKLRRHEHPLVGACREVVEETGVHPRAVARLPTVDYLVRVDGAVVDKVVDYWAMAAVSIGPSPHGVEVDAVSWLPVDAALEQLSYDHDARVVAAFAKLPSLRGPVVVISPAPARGRGWAGPEVQRPLTNAGAARSRQLARLLACYAPAELLSAPVYRCIQTLEPLSQRLGIPIRVDPALDASGHRFAELARDVGPVVVCTATPVVDRGAAGTAVPVVNAGAVGTTAHGPGVADGAGWALGYVGDRVATVDELA